MSSTIDQLEDVALGDTLLEARGVTKYFASDSGMLAGLFGAQDVEAVDDVSFELLKGETFALVGESGCGKSTLARTILQLIEPTSGSIRFKGLELTETSNRQLRPVRRDMQIILQDPQASLNPRMKVGQIIEEPMKAHSLYGRADRRERAKELLDLVELDRSYYNRYPHEFSGGQRQRINLARAMSTDPDLIVCDEPVSALDVSVQAQILNTMRELQAEFGFTYLIISHDLSVVRYIADRVAVMYLGHIVELASKEALFEHTKHPYTSALLEAIPIPDPRSRDTRQPLEGDVPSPIDPPSGCRFRTRCPELIQPAGWALTEQEWDAVRSFVRGVKRRSFTLDETPGSDTSHTPSAVETAVDDAYFPEGRPSRVDDIVREACALIADDEWDEAKAVIESRIVEESICAQERPRYTVSTREDVPEANHFVGCHLYRDGAKDVSPARDGGTHRGRGGNALE